MQRTSKYYPIYEKYENIIDNIIDNIPNEENRNKKNNLDNFLGYYNRKPIEGNNVLDSACLIWKKTMWTCSTGSQTTSGSDGGADDR